MDGEGDPGQSSGEQPCEARAEESPESRSKSKRRGAKPRSIVGVSEGGPRREEMAVVPDTALASR